MTEIFAFWIIIMLKQVHHTEQHEWKDSAHAHFQRWAHHYDRDIINVLLFKPCHQRVLAELRQGKRRGLKPIRVLDVGCGTGNLLIQSLRLGSHVQSGVGIDMSDNMIDYAREKVEAMKLAGKLSFMVGDAEHLPFPDNSFDVVTCCNSFHHYPHQDRAVSEALRVLDNNGRYLLIDGYRDDPLGHFIFDICVTRAENHVHHCSVQRFRNLLNDAGFVKVKQNVFGVCPPAIMNIAYAEK